MKKMFISSMCILAIALTFSLNSQGSELIENEAFATGGCCNETDSLCGLGGRNFFHFYYQSSGPCGAKKPTVESIQ